MDKPLITNLGTGYSVLDVVKASGQEVPYKLCERRYCKRNTWMGSKKNRCVLIVGDGKVIIIKEK